MALTVLLASPPSHEASARYTPQSHSQLRQGQKASARREKESRAGQNALIGLA
jgi:hypothetical protein